MTYVFYLLVNVVNIYDVIRFIQMISDVARIGGLKPLQN